MKHIVSVSLGSTSRNHDVVEQLGQYRFRIQRIGTDGDKIKAKELIAEFDGKVDAFGLGGTDIYIYAGGRRYTFKESQDLAATAKKTPIVDGSGLKNTLERRVIAYLQEECGISLRNKNVLLVCGLDRFGLAESLTEVGCRIVFGDIIFGLGVPIPIRSLRGLSNLARLAAPIITRMPVKLFYPTGKQQNDIKPRFRNYFDQADIIAGDFHFIRRNMPENLTGKMIITNTVTKQDEYLLQNRGIATLVTTTPEMQGRSFGTNVLEAVLVAVAGKPIEQIKSDDYKQLLDQLQIKPRVRHFG